MVANSYYPVKSYAEVGTLSVIAITLCYIFALLYNVLTLLSLLIVIALSTYAGAVIASDSCRSKLIDQRYRFSVFGYAFQLLQFLCVQNYRTDLKFFAK